MSHTGRISKEEKEEAMLRSCSRATIFLAVGILACGVLSFLFRVVK